MCSVNKENFFKLKYLFSCEDCSLSEESTASQGEILIAHGSQQGMPPKKFHFIANKLRLVSCLTNFIGVGDHYEHYLTISYDKAKIQQYQWHAPNFSKQSTSISLLNETSYVVAMTYLPLSISHSSENKTEKLYLLLGFESGRISIYDWKTLYYTGFLPNFELKKDLCISTFTVDKSLSLTTDTHNSPSNSKTGSLLIHYSTKQNTKRRLSDSNVGSKNVVMGVSLKDFHNYLKKTQMVSIYPISFHIYILPNDMADYAILPSFECHTFNCLTSVLSEKNLCVLPELNAFNNSITKENDINSIKSPKEIVNDAYPPTGNVLKYSTRKKQCKELSDIEKERKEIFLSNLKESVAYGLKHFFARNSSLIFCILSNETFLYQMTTKPPQNEDAGIHEKKKNCGDKNLPNVKFTENFATKKSPHILKGVTLGLKATSSVFSYVKPLSSRWFGHVENFFFIPSDSNDPHEDIPVDTVSLNIEKTDACTLTAFSHSEYTEDLEISSNIHLKPVFLYPFKTRLDQDRRGLRLFQCPYNNHLALATDSFGRVLFLHLPSMQLVYMWKGYRFAQVAWIRRNDHLYIVLYAPLQGILEFWSLETIQRIHAIKVSMHGVLVSNQNHINQDETVPFVFVNNKGCIFILSTHLSIEK